MTVQNAPTAQVPTPSNAASRPLPRAEFRSEGAGPVAPLAATTLRPLPLAATTLTEGFLADLQQENGGTSIRRGHAHLKQQQAWENFERAASRAVGPHHGPVFEDGEAFKWLESVAWEEGRAVATDREHEDLDRWLEEYSDLAARAQAEDGYLSTYNQSAGVRERWEWISYDHEIFNMATMIQAAVAQYRATGATSLLDVARRAADHLEDTFGWGKREETCGHPLIEMALVELYRTVQEPRYLHLAQYFVDMRGHGSLNDPTWQGWTSVYFSDRVPVRETEHLEGHAVRAVYLAAGATDVALETGDEELLAAVRTQWENMVEAKMYVNGSLGARWEGEAFGDPYELPSDRGYGETCAAIASLQWSWRLLLATGETRYADLIERQFYNAVLSGVSQDGDKYFYVNTLQVREGAVAYDDRMGAAGRQRWFGCSCCPTNLMRTIATIQQYVATGDDASLQIHQYASGEIRHGNLLLRMTSEFPFDGRVRLEVLQAGDSEETGESELAISLRIPTWADGARLVHAGQVQEPAAGSMATLRSAWTAGDVIELDLPMHPRLVHGHHRVDAVRGAVALERGPLVYALEHVDQPDELRLDDVALADGAVAEGGVQFTVRTVEVEGLRTLPIIDVPVVCRPEGTEATAVAIPYFLWANRELGPMRVWIPVDERDRRHDDTTEV